MIDSPGGVTGGCQDLSVTKETAAGQVACVGQTAVCVSTGLNEHKLLFELFSGAHLKLPKQLKQTEC